MAAAKAALLPVSYGVTPVTATTNEQNTASSKGATPATLCLSFDNMGMARAIGAGTASKPDPDEPGLKIGHPRVLDLLDELGIKATFFIEAWNCLHHGDQVLETARRGHDVAMHGFAHERFGSLSQLQAEQVLFDSYAAFRNLGISPVGFRAPGGVRGPYAIAPLSELGMIYDSSLQEDDSRERPSEQFVQPHIVAPGLAALPFRWKYVDGYMYRSDPGPRTPDYLLKQWNAMLDRCASEGATLTVIFHPYLSGTQDDRFDAMRSFLQYAQTNPAVQISTVRARAEQVLAPDSPS